MNWQHRAAGIAYSLKKAGRTGQPARQEAGADAVRLEACACGWAAELGTHYRVRLAHTKGSAARGTCRSSCMGR